MTDPVKIEGGCPRRLVPMANGEEDFWDTDDSCTYCGSLNPATVLKRVLAGTVAITPTDKVYKAYVRNDGGDDFDRNYKADDGTKKTDKMSTAKFYFQHLSDDQQAEFIKLHNDRVMKLDHPHHFYTRPYFAYTKY